MAKAYNLKDIKLLLENLGSYTGQPLTFYGFGQISHQMREAVSQQYLYYSLHKRIESALKKGDSTLNLSPHQIEEITTFLGHSNFDTFISAKKNPIHPMLNSLDGNYYSYVRKNTIVGAVLQSPVRIDVDNNKASFQLKGAKWDYTGDLRYDDGCLSCLMLSTTGKFFHHVYKMGKSESPQVLMGVFSGISSANDPIGGRCVLVRQESAYEDLENSKMNIDELLASDNNTYRKLGRYFSKYEDNNLAIPKPSGFDLDDLG